MKHLRTLLLPALLLIPAASHAANTAPEAVSQSVNTPEDKGKVITLTASDVDAGSALSYTIVTRPANGTLVGTGPTQLYVPLANFNGSDSFTFTASDGVLDSPPATVSITVDPVAEPALDGPAFPEFVDPNPSGGNGFGTAVIPLNTGNVVITSPNADISGVANCGAVYLFNGSTGALISTLTGSTANDQVGGTSATGVMALASGNFVVLSPNWDNGAVVDAGAATWGNGTTGVSGAVSAANSLVGSKATDQVGSGATVLTNGNYVVRSVNWDNGAISNAGAVTWGSGTAGVSGAVSAANSLVGPTANDNVGLNGVTALTNGNYVVLTGTWDNGAVMNVGAATWRSGTTATSGTVSAANSLVGTKANDNVGSQNATALANGNYVVRSTGWDNGAAVNAGAVTWGNGTTGVSGVVGPANSLVGSKTDDSVGSPSVTALANGSYVVVSQNWDNVSAADAGAATWGSGTAGVSGAVSAANSLVGSTANNSVGTGGVTVLTNGNYVVRSQNWDNGAVADVGAATWGSGTAGVSGAVNATNSLIGSTASDNVSVGGVTALANGSYVVRSQSWDNGAAVNAGAATWGSGTAGVSGAVSAANSLVGSTANDFVGGGNFTVLANGNYVVASWYWDNGAATDAGAATWGSGTAGVSGAVSAANSLVGSTASDQVGTGMTALANGNYVVASSGWDNGAVVDVGAATWGNGTTGTSGAVDAANSLIGSTAADLVGNSGVTALTNGNYVVRTPLWDNGAIINVGAATWGSGAAGIIGVVSTANSLVGSVASDTVGTNVTALANGNYVVHSTSWDDGALANAGAVTWGSGTAGISGAVSPANSQPGRISFSNPNTSIGDNLNNHYLTYFTNEFKVRLGSQENGPPPPLPTVTAIAPAGGSTSGGTTVTITGTNFVAPATVTLGGTAATDVAVVNATTLTATTPAHAAGAAAVLVTTLGGTSEAGSHFIYGPAPVADPQSVATVEDKGKLITLTASDADADSALSYTIATPPANGTLVGSGPTVVYVPFANYNGSDSFTFTASDGASDSPPATVSITVDPVAEPEVTGPAFPEFVDPNPSAGNGFGAAIVPLNTGNVVITSPQADISGITNCGAVYLFNGSTGALISTLVGSTATDQIGSSGVTALTNGNFVVRSQNWDNGAVADVGAATWGSGTTGVSGPVSAANSLVGLKTDDYVGLGVTALVNGNYVVSSNYWDNGAASNAGAATWGNGTTGISGAVSAANSLVGSKANDNVGVTGVTALTNGNYVVISQSWSNGVGNSWGAVTWGNGTTGLIGAVSAANSLIGSISGDQVGGSGVIALANGNYVVRSSSWSNGTAGTVGAATWGNGTTGITGAVSAANSLVGSTTGDTVGNSGVTALANGNYVVLNQSWDNGAAADVGAATWGSGKTGVSGVISAANSLVGSTASDSVGSNGVTALVNGSYVVRSQNWDNVAATNAGAVTWGSGTGGISGAVSAANSLVGSRANDSVGAGVTALTNGNYVVSSSNWDNGTLANVGAATWGSGTAGVVGVVGAANSLIGSTANSNVSNSVTALTNGNYVVSSYNWSNGAVANVGAATWGSGTSGIIGVVSAANSLVGTTVGDYVGLAVTALANGNYVVRSTNWDSGAVVNVGAVTWGGGTAGISGAVSAANSLVGSKANDNVGLNGVTALANGNYVVGSSGWDNGAVVNAGAVTWGSGTAGVSGTVSAANSQLGRISNASPGTAFAENFNNHFLTRFSTELKVRIGSQENGFSTPAVTTIAPASGSTSGGTSVTITGTNFVAPATVTLGGTAATNVVVVNATTLTATTPARAAGAVGVLVTTPGGTSAADTLFTYLAPDIAVSQSGTLLTDGVSSVAFGTVAAGGSGSVLTFTVSNPGTVDLANLAVSVDGTHAAQFTVGTLSATAIASGEGTATFTVTFNPNSNGPKTAAIHIASDAAGAKNPFDIQLSGEGNTPPIFSGYAAATPYEKAAAISLGKLLAAASDPDGDMIGVTSVPASSEQGGTVLLQASAILYTPPAGFSGADRFTVTLTDSRGASTVGTVTVTVQSNSGVGSNPPVLTVLPNGQIGLGFQGIPGRSYEIQRSTDLDTWQVLATVTASPANGAVSFIDESPPQPNGYYRLRQP